MEVTKDMLIGDVIRQKPEVIEVLLGSGLGCIGCPSSQSESIEQAAMVHGIDVDQLVAKLNA